MHSVHCVQIFNTVSMMAVQLMIWYRLPREFYQKLYTALTGFLTCRWLSARKSILGDRDSKTVSELLAEVDRLTGLLDDCQSSAKVPTIHLVAYLHVYMFICNV